MSSQPATPLPADSDRPAGVAGGEPPAAETGTFQHYQVLRRPDGTLWELGRGTMGITYKALDTNLRSAVALKVVNSTLINHLNARERFVREARAAAALRHHNVASVYHLGIEGENFFYAMEFIDGETLDALVRRQGPLPVGTALRLALQAARALAAAARQKLVHRDIKPANLMVVHEDADEHMVVKVIDFGLARPVAGDDGNSDSGAGSLTIHGFVGTPQYASPEQLEERTLDARSDIYSLGVTLWFLLTGKPPFSGSLAGICHQHLSKPPPWAQLPASVPEPARRLLAHTLEKDPRQRPQSAVDLRYEIEACLEALNTPVPPTAVPADAPATAIAPGAGGLVAKIFANLGLQRETPVLPASETPSAEASPLPVAPAPAGTWPEAGTLLAGRYDLVRLAGEGGSGRVFEARDRDNGGRTVAVKILRPGIGGSDEETRDKMRLDARQVSAAPHPHLTELLSLELPAAFGAGGPSYLTEEWLRGFTLRDLLAARNGTLPAVEGLRLLCQAAGAVDHASSRRLERLELGIHQVYLHFPAGGGPAQETPGRRALLGMSMEEWPEWSLKIEPFGVSRDAGESGTWMGEVTLLPGSPLSAGLAGASGDADPLAAGYLHSLARIAYELLGGQPPSRTTAAKYVSLPTLGESANAVLARALLGNPGFESAWKFYEAFASAAGFVAESLLPATSVPGTLPRPALPAIPLPSPPTRAAARPAVDASAAITRARSETISPVSSARTMDTTGSSARTIPPTYPPAAEGAPEVPDPWQESQLARMLEDEENKGLVDPSSTGFALTIGALIGLVLLIIVFAAMAWFRATPRPPIVSHGTHSPAGGTAAERRGRGTAVTTPAPRRAIPVSTPPPLPPTAADTPAPTVPLLAQNVPAATMPPLASSPPPVVAPSPDEPRRALPVSSPSPPPANDRTVAVQIRSNPAGAEISLRGASLGRTPLNVNLAPGNYEFVARYRDWTEVHRDMHLSADQAEASTDIGFIPPNEFPPGGRFSPVSENHRRQPQRRGNYPVPGAGGVDDATLSEHVRIYRARPVPTEAPAVGTDAVPPVRRALPVPEPFLRVPPDNAPTTRLPED